MIYLYLMLTLTLISSSAYADLVQLHTELHLLEHASPHTQQEQLHKLKQSLDKIIDTSFEAISQKIRAGQAPNSPEIYGAGATFRKQCLDRLHENKAKTLIDNVPAQKELGLYIANKIYKTLGSPGKKTNVHILSQLESGKLNLLPPQIFGPDPVGNIFDIAHEEFKRITNG